MIAIAACGACLAVYSIYADSPCGTDSQDSLIFGFGFCVTCVTSAVFGLLMLAVCCIAAGKRSTGARNTATQPLLQQRNEAVLHVQQQPPSRTPAAATSGAVRLQVKHAAGPSRCLVPPPTLSHPR